MVNFDSDARALFAEAGVDPSAAPKLLAEVTQILSEQVAKWRELGRSAEVIASQYATQRARLVPQIAVRRDAGKLA